MATRRHSPSHLSLHVSCVLGMRPARNNPETIMQKSCFHVSKMCINRNYPGTIPQCKDLISFQSENRGFVGKFQLNLETQQ